MWDKNSQAYVFITNSPFYLIFAAYFTAMGIFVGALAGLAVISESLSGLVTLGLVILSVIYCWGFVDAESDEVNEAITVLVLMSLPVFFIVLIIYGISYFWFKESLVYNLSLLILLGIFIFWWSIIWFPLILNYCVLPITAATLGQRYWRQMIIIMEKNKMRKVLKEAKQVRRELQKVSRHQVPSHIKDQKDKQDYIKSELTNLKRYLEEVSLTKKFILQLRQRYVDNWDTERIKAINEKFSSLQQLRETVFNFERQDERFKYELKYPEMEYRGKEIELSSKEADLIQKQLDKEQREIEIEIKKIELELLKLELKDRQEEEG